MPTNSEKRIYLKNYHTVIKSHDKQARKTKIVGGVAAAAGVAARVGLKHKVARKVGTGAALGGGATMAMGHSMGQYNKARKIIHKHMSGGKVSRDERNFLHMRNPSKSLSREHHPVMRAKAASAWGKQSQMFKEEFVVRSTDMTREEIIEAIVESAWSEKNLPTYHKAKKSIASSRQRRRKEFRSTERAIGKSPKLRKVYSRNKVKYVKRGRRINTALGVGAGALVGGLPGAVIGGTAANLSSRAEARYSKTSKRMAHHIGVVGVKRHQKKEKASVADFKAMAKGK